MLKSLKKLHKRVSKVQTKDKMFESKEEQFKQIFIDDEINLFNINNAKEFLIKLGKALYSLSHSSVYNGKLGIGGECYKHYSNYLAKGFAITQNEIFYLKSAINNGEICKIGYENDNKLTSIDKNVDKIDLDITKSSCKKFNSAKKNNKIVENNFNYSQTDKKSSKTISLEIDKFCEQIKINLCNYGVYFYKKNGVDFLKIFSGNGFVLAKTQQNYVEKYIKNMQKTIKKK